jgi:hypothetical protein
MISQIAIARLQMSEGYESGICDSNLASGARKVSGVRQSRPRRVSVVGENASPKSLKRTCASDNEKFSAHLPRDSGQNALVETLGGSGPPSHRVTGTASGSP